uniref:Uncharacterized protein n=1 Tax=Trichuris muris TaxID=70415 RepID=A0A5S6Q7D8_TRIMR
MVPDKDRDDDTKQELLREKPPAEEAKKWPVQMMGGEVFDAYREGEADNERLKTKAPSCSGQNEDFQAKEPKKLQTFPAKVGETMTKDLHLQGSCTIGREKVGTLSGKNTDGVPGAREGNKKAGNVYELKEFLVNGLAARRAWLNRPSNDSTKNSGFTSKE